MVTKQKSLWQIALCMLVCVVALTGCGNQNKLETVQRENQALTERVAELEEELRLTEEHISAQAAARTPQAPMPAVTPTPQGQAHVSVTEYTVAAGDNLWEIARKKLGNGNRYKEILALNPQIDPNRPLAIGTKLKLPAH